MAFFVYNFCSFVYGFLFFCLSHEGYERGLRGASMVFLLYVWETGSVLFIVRVDDRRQDAAMSK